MWIYIYIIYVYIHNNLSIYLSIHLSIHPSIHLSIYRSIYIYIYIISSDLSKHQVEVNPKKGHSPPKTIYGMKLQFVFAQMFRWTLFPDFHHRNTHHRYETTSRQLVSPSLVAMIQSLWIQVFRSFLGSMTGVSFRG